MQVTDIHSRGHLWLRWARARAAAVICYYAYWQRSRLEFQRVKLSDSGDNQLQAR
jgi:hypothetical protein